MTLWKILIYLSYFSVLAPLISALIKRKIWDNGIMKVMSILLVASAASDAASYVLAKMHISNLPVVNAYFIVSFALLLILYSILMERRKLIILVAGQVLLIYFILTSLDTWGNFQSINTAIQSVALIVLGLLYYFDLYKQLPTDNLARFAPMWFNAAIVCYYSFNLFLFLIASYVFENMSAGVATTFWSFHNLNNIVKNVLLAAGIYLGEEWQMRDLLSLTQKRNSPP